MMVQAPKMEPVSVSAVPEENFHPDCANDSRLAEALSSFFLFQL